MSDEIITSGNVPQRSDPRRFLLVKEVLATIAGGGGGGGTIQVFQDATGAPPTDATKPALSFPTGGGTISQWDVPSQTWK